MVSLLTLFQTEIPGLHQKSGRNSITIRHSATNILPVPPANGWTNRTPQPDDRGIPTGLYQPGTGRLGAVHLLPMSELAYNNSTMTANGMPPFYSNYGFHPVAAGPASTEPRNPASTVYAHWMCTAHDESRRKLEEARERMRRYTNPTRKEPPAYQVGDLVMLSGRNIKTCRPTKKLDHMNHGPFQIKKIISPLAIHITLPRK